MSQIASPGTSPLDLLACDVVAVGDSVDLLAGAVSTRGVIVAIAPSSLVLSVPGDLRVQETDFTLTRTDLDGVAWTAQCQGRVTSPRRVEITERIAWTAVDRNSARVTADRRAVRAEWDEGRQLQRQRGLVALDVSASGCRLSGNGAPPPAGARIRLDISTTTYGEAQWLSAEVMRVETSAFGRYLLGLRFILESSDDYSRVLAWRDASLRR
jgi:hypothetical protein